MKNNITIGAPLRECPKCITQGKLCPHHAHLEEKKNDRDYKERLKPKDQNVKTLQQLKTDLEIYQESFNEADTSRAREHYRELCHKTHAEIEDFVVPPVTKNYLPVVGSLLKKLQLHGFTLVSVDDGGETHHLTGTNRDQRQQVKAAICAVDESHLYVDNSEGVRKWLFLVLGNEPEETVCDYSGDGCLDTVLEEFSNQWEGKPCPTK